MDFLSIQEIFKFLNVDKFFKSGFKDFSSYVIPGHRSPGQMTGRARAGLAQLCRREYDVKKVRVSTSGLMIQVLELPTTGVLWLNTSLPNDPKLQNHDDGDLKEVLE